MADSAAGYYGGRRWTRTAPRTSTPSSTSPRPTRADSTSPATRAAPVPIPASAQRSATPRCALDFPSGVEGIDVGPDPLDLPFQQSQAARGRGLGRAPQLVPGQRGLRRQPRDLHGARPPRRPRHRPAQRPLLGDRRARPQRPAPDLPRARDRRRTRGRPLPDRRRARGGSPASSPDVVAVFAVSPTYFGAVADIGGLASVAHAHDVPLVVDESWGAHLAFSDRLPANALACGADVVLNSVHKLGGSMTQSAILHLGADEEHPDGRIDGRIVDRSVTLVESTSPSAILSASLDAARRQNAIVGPGAARRDDRLADRAAPARSARSPGSTCSARRSPQADSVFAWDPLRVSIDVRGTGTTGNRIAKYMRERARHLVRALRRERRRRRLRDRRERRRDRRAADRRPPRRRRRAPAPSPTSRRRRSPRRRRGGRP